MLLEFCCRTELIQVSESKTRNFIRARLIEQGTNLDAWAREHGYKERTVSKVISRFIGNDGKPPEGSISREIIDALEADTGVRICG